MDITIVTTETIYYSSYIHTAKDNIRRIVGIVT